MPQITPVALKTRVAQTIKSFLSDQPSYMFYGKHVSDGNDSSAELIYDNVAIAQNVFDNMIEGTKINETNLAYLIPNIQWQSGVVYPCYTQTVTGPVHVVVLSGVNYNVYKCISNNSGAASTAAPTSTTTTPVTTVDGYVWLFMGTISQAQRNKFETTKYVPFEPNQTMVAAAQTRRSSLDRVDVVSGGLGWTNSFAGTFRAADVAYGTTSFGLVETAPAIAGYFSPGVIKITQPGSPIEGQFRTITGYTSGRILTIASPFSAMPQAGDSFEISPLVSITSSNAGATAVGRALVSNTGVITSVEILQAGANLFNCTATALANAAVGVSAPATLQPVVSPAFGHGGSPLNELFATAVGVSATFDLTNVIKANDFRHYGVITNPLYNNVVVEVTPGPGTAFTILDDVVVYRTKGTANGSVSVTGAVVTGTGTLFTAATKKDDYVRISNNTVSVIATVSSVSNNTSLTLTANVAPPIAGTMELVDVAALGKVAAANTTHITVTNVSGVISPADKIYGTATKTDMAATMNISIGDRTASPFNSFTQATTFVGSITGTYVVDEVVSVGSGQALVHSANSSHLFMTNVKGTVLTGNAIGASSSAVCEPTRRIMGDLVKGSGEIVFVATTTPIARTVGNKQQIIIAIEF